MVVRPLLSAWLSDDHCDGFSSSSGGGGGGSGPLSSQTFEPPSSVSPLNFNASHGILTDALRAIHVVSPTSTYDRERLVAGAARALLLIGPFAYSTCFDPARVPYEGLQVLGCFSDAVGALVLAWFSTVNSRSETALKWKAIVTRITANSRVAVLSSILPGFPRSLPRWAGPDDYNNEAHFTALGETWCALLTRKWVLQWVRDSRWAPLAEIAVVAEADGAASEASTPAAGAAAAMGAAGAGAVGSVDDGAAPHDAASVGVEAAAPAAATAAVPSAPPPAHSSTSWCLCCFERNFADSSSSSSPLTAHFASRAHDFNAAAAGGRAPAPRRLPRLTVFARWWEVAAAHGPPAGYPSAHPNPSPNLPPGAGVGGGIQAKHQQQPGSDSAKPIATTAAAALVSPPPPSRSSFMASLATLVRMRVTGAGLKLANGVYTESRVALSDNGTPVYQRRVGTLVLSLMMFPMRDGGFQWFLTAASKSNPAYSDHDHDLYVMEGRDAPSPLLPQSVWGLADRLRSCKCIRHAKGTPYLFGVLPVPRVVQVTSTLCAQPPLLGNAPTSTSAGAASELQLGSGTPAAATGAVAVAPAAAAATGAVTAAANAPTVTAESQCQLSAPTKSHVNEVLAPSTSTFAQGKASPSQQQQQQSSVGVGAVNSTPAASGNPFHVPPSTSTSKLAAAEECASLSAASETTSTPSASSENTSTSSSSDLQPLPPRSRARRGGGASAQVEVAVDAAAASLVRTHDVGTLEVEVGGPHPSHAPIEVEVESAFCGDVIDVSACGGDDGDTGVECMNDSPTQVEGGGAPRAPPLTPLRPLQPLRPLPPHPPTPPQLQPGGGFYVNTAGDSFEVPYEGDDEEDEVEDDDNSDDDGRGSIQGVAPFESRFETQRRHGLTAAADYSDDDENDEQMKLALAASLSDLPASTTSNTVPTQVSTSAGAARVLPPPPSINFNFGPQPAAIGKSPAAGASAAIAASVTPSISTASSASSSANYAALAASAPLGPSNFNLSRSTPASAASWSAASATDEDYDEEIVQLNTTELERAESDMVFGLPNTTSTSAVTSGTRDLRRRGAGAGGAAAGSLAGGARHSGGHCDVDTSSSNTSFGAGLQQQHARPSVAPSVSFNANFNLNANPEALLLVDQVMEITCCSKADAVTALERSAGDVSAAISQILAIS